MLNTWFNFCKNNFKWFFLRPFWKNLNISNIFLWSDNGPHFKNKLLLLFYSQIISKKIFSFISCNFFEPYHGKSFVDGQFGQLSKWITNWSKHSFLNTSEDLLNCFEQSNKFSKFPNRNFFEIKEIEENIWKEQHLTLLNFSFKHFNCFYFYQEFPTKFYCSQYNLKLNINNEFFFDKEIFQTYNIETEIKKIIKNPKYAHNNNLNEINSPNLTESDIFLLYSKVTSLKINIPTQTKKYFYEKINLRKKNKKNISNINKKQQQQKQKSDRFNITKIT